MIRDMYAIFTAVVLCLLVSAICKQAESADTSDQIIGGISENSCQIPWRLNVLMASLPGCVVDLSKSATSGSGTVRGLDNFRKSGARSRQQGDPAIVYHKLLDKNDALKAQILALVTADMSQDDRLEVTTTRLPSVGIENDDLDQTKLETFVNNIPAADRDKYGIIMAASFYEIDTSIYRTKEAKIGAVIYSVITGDGTHLYKNTEDKKTYYLFAMYYPLPMVPGGNVPARGPSGHGLTPMGLPKQPVFKVNITDPPRAVLLPLDQLPIIQ